MVSAVTKVDWGRYFSESDFSPERYRDEDFIARQINQNGRLPENALPLLREYGSTRAIVFDSSIARENQIAVMVETNKDPIMRNYLNIVYNEGAVLYVGPVDSNVVVGYSEVDEAVGKYFFDYRVAIAETQDSNGHRHSNHYVTETVKHELFHAVSFLHKEHTGKLITQLPPFAEAYAADLQALKQRGMLPAQNGKGLTLNGKPINLSHQLTVENGGNHFNEIIAREELFAEMMAVPELAQLFPHSAKVLQDFNSSLIQHIQTGRTEPDMAIGEAVPVPKPKPDLDSAPVPIPKPAMEETVDGNARIEVAFDHFLGAEEPMSGLPRSIPPRAGATRGRQ